MDNKKPHPTKSQSLPLYTSYPSKNSQDHRTIYGEFEKEKRQSKRINYFCFPLLQKKKKCDESSLSSDTSCSSVEYFGPSHWGRPKIQQPTYMTIPAPDIKCEKLSVSPKLTKIDLNQHKGSMESISRKIRKEAVKAKVEAERAKYKDSSSEEESYYPINGMARYHSEETLSQKSKRSKSSSKRRNRCETSQIVNTDRKLTNVKSISNSQLNKETTKEIKWEESKLYKYPHQYTNPYFSPEDSSPSSYHSAMEFNPSKNNYLYSRHSQNQIYKLTWSQKRKTFGDPSFLSPSSQSNLVMNKNLQTNLDNSTQSISPTYESGNASFPSSPHDSGFSTLSIMSPHPSRAPTPPPRSPTNKSRLLEEIHHRNRASPLPPRSTVNHEYYELMPPNTENLHYYADNKATENANKLNNLFDSFLNTGQVPYGRPPTGNNSNKKVSSPKLKDYTENNILRSFSFNGNSSNLDNPNDQCNIDQRKVYSNETHQIDFNKYENNQFKSLNHSEFSPFKEIPFKQNKPIDLEPIPCQNIRNTKLEIAQKKIDQLLENERQRNYSEKLDYAMIELEKVYSGLEINEDRLNKSFSPEPKYPLTRCKSDSWQLTPFNSFRPIEMAFKTHPKMSSPNYRRHLNLLNNYVEKLKEEKLKYNAFLTEQIPPNETKLFKRERSSSYSNHSSTIQEPLNSSSPESVASSICSFSDSVKFKTEFKYENSISPSPTSTQCSTTKTFWSDSESAFCTESENKLESLLDSLEKDTKQVINSTFSKETNKGFWPLSYGNSNNVSSPIDLKSINFQITIPNPEIEMAQQDTMRQNMDGLTSTERIAKYKEERRKQLAMLTTSKTDARPLGTPVRDSLEKVNQLISRSTKASRLRILANTPESVKIKPEKERVANVSSRSLTDVNRNFSKPVEVPQANGSTKCKNNDKNIKRKSLSNISIATDLIKPRTPDAYKPSSEIVVAPPNDCTTDKQTSKSQETIRLHSLDKTKPKNTALKRPEIPKVLQIKKEESSVKSSDIPSSKGNSSKKNVKGVHESINSKDNSVAHSDSAFATPLCDSIQCEVPPNIEKPSSPSLPSTAPLSASLFTEPISRVEGGVKAKTKFWTALNTSNKSFTPQNNKQPPASNPLSSILKKEKPPLQQMWKEEPLPTPTRTKLDSRPPSILKKKGSLEEKDYTAPQKRPGLHSILKKHSSEEDERRSSSPDIHPILKNRILDDPNERRPILKKRSSLIDDKMIEKLNKCDLPKPILKKKSNIEGRPKPILKSKKSEEETWPSSISENMSGPRANSSDTGIKSILKKVGSRNITNSALEKLKQSRRVSLESGMISNMSLKKESNSMIGVEQASNEAINNINQNVVVASNDPEEEPTRIKSEAAKSTDNDNKEEEQPIVSEVNASFSTKTVLEKKKIFESSRQRRQADRYKTQPITFEEVHKAAQLSTTSPSNNDPCHLSLKEKLKLFSEKTSTTKINRRATQPITLSEVKKARYMSLEPITSNNSSPASETKNFSFQEQSHVNHTIEAKATLSANVDENLLAKLSSSSSETVKVRSRSISNCETTAAKLEVYTESITDRLNRLSQNAQDGWKKRIDKLKDTKEIESNSLADITLRVTKLEESQESWKTRIEQKDAVQFTVAGKMSQVPTIVASPLLNRKRAVPKPLKFTGDEKISVRSQSFTVTSKVSQESTIKTVQEHSLNRVKVLKIDDEETFGSFFSQNTQNEHLVVDDVNLEDICDKVQLLSIAKKTRIKANRRNSSKNPLKVLASRSDLEQEYFENNSKGSSISQIAKQCEGLALSALAGLASREDFTGVSLKKAEDASQSLLPQKDLMLLQVKGRRHIQTRLVAPMAESVNQGDTYILVTPSRVFLYSGPLSNVIECAKGAEVATIIQAKKDLCFSGHQPVVNCMEPCHELLKQLGGDQCAATYAGPPEEDEAYELAMIDTTKVYYVEGVELIPHPDCWGVLPSVKLLLSDEVLVFDFGGELYVWQGKLASFEKRKIGVELARQMWEAGFNYEECGVNPLTPNLGAPLKENFRPPWALFAKINQHMESVLFREKFSDWPDLYQRLIRVKRDESGEEGNFEKLKPCEIEPLINDPGPPEPDLVLEGAHLGRGPRIVGDVTQGPLEVSTLTVTVWLIQEYESREIDNSATLYSGDSYVIRWQYSTAHQGRSLSGQKTRHSYSGRDRCAYFFWQGRDSTITEKGASALMTVELDEERGPQVRVVQGKEPPCFLSIFEGKLIVLNGKLTRSNQREGWEKRLLMVKGEFGSEATLEEAPCTGSSLRSRGCFVLVDSSGTIFLWKGSQATTQMINVASKAVSCFARPNFPQKVSVLELNEGEESSEFWAALDYNTRSDYNFLSVTNMSLPPRVFQLSGFTGEFLATRVVCPWWTKIHESMFPVTQEELYSNQLALVDAGPKVYLWQGPEGSNYRRIWECALTSALLYSQQKGTKTHCYLVWGGLEPVEFTNLFPQWTVNSEIKEISLMNGRKVGELRDVALALQEFTRSQYSLAELKQLPEGVDPMKLESYLPVDEFEQVLGVSKQSFYKLPSWRRSRLKQAAGLF